MLYMMHETCDCRCNRRSISECKLVHCLSHSSWHAGHGCGDRAAVILMSTQYDDLSDDGYVAGHDKVMSVLEVNAFESSLSHHQ